MVAMIKKLAPHYSKTTDVHGNPKTEKAQSHSWMTDPAKVRDQQHLHVGVRSNAYSGLWPAGTPRSEQGFQLIYMSTSYLGKLYVIWIGPRAYAYKYGPLIGSTCG